MNTRILEELAKDVIELNTPDVPLTPRTDAEHAKTLTPAYEYEGAEQEAWAWARKLEKELIRKEADARIVQMQIDQRYIEDNL